MIAASPTTKTVQTNITGQSYSAGIDDENMAHIIGLFTDLYSDRELAVIREYSTNALDAQIEAGYTGPIEVDLPSPLSPFFKVRDHGVGLSHDDIRTIYSRYGTSTKRATNDQNGMLGLGCKSALTYSDQFTVESVKDGTKMVCSISRDGQAVPVMTVVDTRATDDPNGTTVVVPARRGNNFAEKAAEFFSYWKPGTVLVNGQPPRQIEGLRVSDNILLRHTDTYGRGQDKVLMGGVAYPHNFNLGLPYGWGVVVEVPIGSVEFAPSREALSYSTRTNNALDEAVDREAIMNGVVAQIQSEVDRAADAQGAIQASLTYKSLGTWANGSHFAPTYRWKSYVLPSMVGGECMIAHRNSHRYNAITNYHKGIPLEFVPDTLFIEGYDVEKFTASHKKKLLKYAEDNDLRPDYFAMCVTAPKSSVWVRSDQIHQWADVKAIKLPVNRSATTRDGRPTGSYDAYVFGRSDHVQAADIDTSKPIYYTGGSRYNAANFAGYLPDATIVYLPENRKAKFLRNFPSARQAEEGIKDQFDALVKSLTADEKKRIALRREGFKIEFPASLLALIEDPAVKEAARIAALPLPDAYATMRELESQSNYIVEWDGFEWDGDALAKYPLIHDLGYSTMTDEPGHVALYMNAVYRRQDS